MQEFSQNPRYRLAQRLYHRHEPLGPPLLFLRGITFKRHVRPGQWRVSVETADGCPIGRVSFEIVTADSPARPLSRRAATSSNVFPS